MPRPKWEKYRERVGEILNSKKFIVKNFGDYKVLIQIPDGKSECDFYVWYAKFVNEKVIEYKVPSHDDLAKWYSKLKESSKEIDEYLINAVIRLIRDRLSVEEIVEKYFANLDKNIKLEISKFLSTLKWISLQEDTNYPRRVIKF